MKKGVGVLPAAVRNELLALYSTGQWARLVIAAERATTRYPRQLLAWRALGKALFQLGRIPEAIERLSRVVRLAPGEADGYNDLGNAYYGVGRVEEALATYRHAAALNPDSPEVHSNIGRVLCDLHRYDEAIECCRRAIELNPASAIAQNNMGNAFSGKGMPDEAEVCYRCALAAQPLFVDALINLGSVLVDQGRWHEAIDTYRAAVRTHPNSGNAHNALGRLLSRLREDDEAARLSLERAIALNAADANTYAELGNILMRQKNTEAALDVFRAGQQLQPFITWPARQEKAAFSALFLDTPMGGSTPVNYLAGKACYDRHLYCVMPDRTADIELLRGKADVIFNMISNPDDADTVLPAALDLVERIGRPTINHPRMIMLTDRETMARRLTDIDACVIPRTFRMDGSAVMALAEAGWPGGLQPPFLVRVAGTHGGDEFEKLNGWSEVVSFVSRAVGRSYYLSEYVDYRSDDGFFRKYRVMFVNGELLPYHLAIHNDWKVHHFRTDMADHVWMRREEERFLADMSNVFGTARLEALNAIARVSGLDYGGIDCALDPRDRVVIFEANASMLVHDEKNSEFAYKNPYIAKIKSAFDDMLSSRRAGT